MNPDAFKAVIYHGIEVRRHFLIFEIVPCKTKHTLTRQTHTRILEHKMFSTFDYIIVGGGTAGMSSPKIQVPVENGD